MKEPTLNPASAGAAIGRAAPEGDGGAEPPGRRTPRRVFEFKKLLGRRLRVGGIDYLNAQPLIEGLTELAGADLEICGHPPSELAARLRDGRLDVALVPVVECFIAPRAPYWVVPGIGISSYGPVESIRLFHSGPLGVVRSAALDASSLTSQLLTRLLFACRPDARWRSGEAGARAGGVQGPIFLKRSAAEVLEAVETPPGRAPASADALLLIGDAALAASPAPGWKAVDLGAEWTRWTGLPFVYAVWVYRGEPIPGVSECLDEARRLGAARLDHIVSRGPLPRGMSRGHALRYLSRTIRYGLGPAELEGLGLFQTRLREAGLLAVEGPAAAAADARPAIRFLETRAGADAGASRRR